MSDFRTTLHSPTYPFEIKHANPLLLLGSCFAENIAEKLQQNKFQSLLNPLGILYNPVSIARALEYLLGNKTFSAANLFYHQDLWHSFDHHGHFSHPDRLTALTKIQQSLQFARNFLADQQRIIISLGSAHVFFHREQERIVANCHKLPSEQFERRRLSLEAIIHPLAKSLGLLSERYAGTEIILTVSPVRHLRDGMVENQRSKATLILAAEALEKQFSNVHYFPAYEWMLDDLRDYRFYETDLCHPNSVAVDYIWNHFKTAFFNPTTESILKKVKSIRLASQHRPFHINTNNHQTFLVQQLQKIAQLEQDYPFLDFSIEKKNLKNQQQ